MGRGRGALPEVPCLSLLSCNFSMQKFDCQGRKSAANANLRSVDFSQGGYLARAPRNEEGELNSARKQGLTSVGDLIPKQQGSF